MADKKEEHKEHKEHEHKEHGKKSSNSMIIPSVIGIVMLVIGFAAGLMIAGTNTTTISTDNVATIAQAKIFNLLQGESAVAVTNVTETNGIYKFTVDVDGRQFDSYMSKDGKILFPSAYDITPEDLNTTVTAPATPQTPEMPKTDKPTVELFVMSFCPYGIQAEQIMKPVFDVLGEKADINIRFIASVGGTTIDSVQSLHGINEATEDLRQLCIAKYYDDATLWDYVSYIAERYPSEFSTSTIETKWKEAAVASSIDTAKIESCLADESLDLMKLDEAKADSYGVRGSPTLIINGQTYSGARSSIAFQQAICAAFTTPPAECGGTVDNVQTTSTGGC